MSRVRIQARDKHDNVLQEIVVEPPPDLHELSYVSIPVRDVRTVSQVRLIFDPPLPLLTTTEAAESLPMPLPLPLPLEYRVWERIVPDDVQPQPHRQRPLSRARARSMTPMAHEALAALRAHGDGATRNDIALALPHRKAAAVTRGINTAIWCGFMHYQPITRPPAGEHNRLFLGPRPTSSEQG